MSEKYLYNDMPPKVFLGTTIIQGVVVAILNLSFLVVLLVHAKLPYKEIFGHMQWMTLAFTLALIFQCLRWKRFGGGYFIPAFSPVVYFAPGIVAIDVGGYELLVVMMIFAGLCEIFLSFVIRHTRLLFTKEVCGFIVFVVGAQIAVAGFSTAFGKHPSYEDVILLFITIIPIILLSVWTKGVIKNIAVLVGIVIGIIVSIFLDNLHFIVPLGVSGSVDFFSLPPLSSFYPFHFEFKWGLAPVFFFAGLAAVVRSMGLLITVREYEEGENARPDYKIIRKSLFAEGILTIFSSFFSGCGINSSPTSATLTLAAKCTSKYMILGMAVIFFILSFIPKLMAYFAEIPAPIAGVIFIYYSTFLFSAGLKMMDPKTFEVRESFSIGLALSWVCCILLFKSTFALLPHWLYIIVQTPLSGGLIISVLLTLCFQINKYKKLSFSLHKTGKKGGGEIGLQVSSFGDNWKIPENITDQAVDVSKEVILQIYSHQLADNEPEVSLKYNKSNFEVNIRYNGELLQIPSLGGKNKIQKLFDEHAVNYGLTRYFKGVYPDDMKLYTNGIECNISLVFYLS